MWGKRLLCAMAVVCMFTFGSAGYAAQDPLKKPEAKARTTTDNLQAAYEGESNAAARYAAFAKKADEEGYAAVASLFRATARAEEIHAGNHAEVLKKMGAEPKAAIKPAEVKTTQQNLQAALAGESYERDTMYPEFLAQASSDKSKDAIRTFNYAMTAETEHAKLYTEALNNLEQWKGPDKRDFFVCKVCGYTTVKIDFEKCPSCFSHKEEYVKIN